MVQLIDSDIKTREVLGWKGVHVLHFAGSSCSQKLRIFLNLKGIPWESHPIDLPGNENFRPWFLGINPRGLVPVLVHDGAVHIESNDIIQHLEKAFPEPRLIPAGHENEVAALLRHEDDLHLDLRTADRDPLVAGAGPREYSRRDRRRETLDADMYVAGSHRESLSRLFSRFGFISGEQEAFGSEHAHDASGCARHDPGQAGDQRAEICQVKPVHVLRR